MRFVLNSEQKKALSDFFNNVAVAWFTAAFTLSSFDPSNTFLIMTRFLVNMGLALFISLYLLKK